MGRTKSAKGAGGQGARQVSLPTRLRWNIEAAMHEGDPSMQSSPAQSHPRIRYAAPWFSPFSHRPPGVGSCASPHASSRQVSLRNQLQKSGSTRMRKAASWPRILIDAGCGQLVWQLASCGAIGESKLLFLHSQPSLSGGSLHRTLATLSLCRTSAISECSVLSNFTRDMPCHGHGRTGRASRKGHCV